MSVFGQKSNKVSVRDSANAIQADQRRIGGKLISADPFFHRYDNGARAILGNGDTIVFASNHLPNLLELTPSLQQNMPLQFAKDLFLFDYWIKNEDRTMSLTSGNPNLFLDVRTHDYVVVDHNLAFDPQYDFAQNAHLHLSYQHWFHQQHDPLWRDYYQPKLEIALHGFAQYAASLPQEWLLAEPDYLAQITATLALFSTTNFGRL